jgi:hypothetical protein
VRKKKVYFRGNVWLAYSVIDGTDANAKSVGQLVMNITILIYVAEDADVVIKLCKSSNTIGVVVNVTVAVQREMNSINGTVTSVHGAVYSLMLMLKIKMEIQLFLLMLLMWKTTALMI